MEDKFKYKIKITLRDGSYYEYKSKYDWDARADKLNDTRDQFYEFDSNRFIVAREAILKVETEEIEADGEPMG